MEDNDILAELDAMIGKVIPGTAEGHRYELLASLVEAYEADKYPIEHSTDPMRCSNLCWRRAA